MNLKHIRVLTSDQQVTKLLLEDINIDIRMGEWISVVGRNGSGKSTLAKVISGLLIPTAGSINYGANIRLPIPYVMQHEDPFIGETAWEDIVFILETRGESSSRIADIASSVLQDVGLSEYMHKPLSTLSGGQRQLAAIAGCLAVDAPFLLFDEATSMLDNESKQLVIQLAMKLHRSGKTIIWLTHQMSEVTVGDRIIALDQARIQFDLPTQLFFYGNGTALHTELSPCEQLGFVPPYPVQIGQALLRRGIAIYPYPKNAHELAEVITYDAE